jgi:putative ABC transport system permease protein
MNIFESLKIALNSLASNKLRSFLTMLGIIIGVGSVIALQSIGEGVVNQEQERVRANGSNLITIGEVRQKVGGVTLSTGNSSLTLEDSAALANQALVTKALAVAPEYRSGGQIVAGSKNTFGEAVGTTEAYTAVRDLSLASGNWFSDDDVNQSREVMVLGATVAKDLFDEDDPVGKSISINRVSFTVVGVLKAKGGNGFGSVDNQVYLPVTTAQKRLFGFRPAGATRVGKTVTDIVAKATDTASVDKLISEVTEVLRERHNIEPGQSDDFEIQNQQDLLKAAKDQAATFTIFLIVIASISLFVGGIGIMNIMLVTVTERTREIGIRKAVGARSFDILMQFLIESVSICFVGGLIGVGFGLIASFVLAKTIPDFPTLVQPSIVVIAVAVAVVVGLFFGIYPARRASKLNPIDALRYE